MVVEIVVRVVDVVLVRVVCVVFVVVVTVVVVEVVVRVVDVLELTPHVQSPLQRSSSPMLPHSSHCNPRTRQCWSDLHVAAAVYDAHVTLCSAVMASRRVVPRQSEPRLYMVEVAS